ncbi:MAG TPA: hypothetical protein VFV97_08345 [Rhodanobacteraceae bacterium]|nr:hypothetical protein [Rhodanobacteraceae bacterium]
MDADFIGRTIESTGALIVTTGIALTIVPQAYQTLVGIAFAAVCGALAILIVVRARQSRRPRRER